MSKLFKSKILLGLVIVAALVVGVAAVKAEAQTSCTLSTTLRQGSTGAEVMCLQTKLGLTADGKFGPMTAAAVKAFQASKGLTADGVVGAMTRAALTGSVVVNPGTNLPAGCTSTAGFSPINGAKCDGGSTPSTDNNGPLSGGEASLESYSIDSEDDAEEGQSAHVATVEFDVEDGDVEINRVDVTFEGVNAPTENEPWDAFDTLTLMIDGKEVAEADLSDEDEWLDDSTPFAFRISDIDYVARAGDTVEMEIHVTAASNVDDAGTDASWKIEIGDEGIRGVDSEGIQSYTGDDTEDVTFSIEGEGGDESIDIQSSSKDPDDTTFLADEDDESEWYEAFVFELEAEESDIEVDTIVLTAATTDASVGDGFYSNLVSDVKLEIDGEEYDDVTVTNAGTALATLTFDIDGDLTIDADDTIDVKVLVEFKKQGDGDGTTTGDAADNYSDGSTIKFATVSVDGEGKDDVTDAGVVSGGTHSLDTSGATVSGLTANSTQNEAGTVGTFTFNFTVEAEEGDVDVNLTNTLATILGDNTGAETYTLVNLDGDATENGANDYTVSEGDSNTFSYAVTVAPLVAGQVYVRLDEAAGVAQNKTAGPENLE